MKHPDAKYLAVDPGHTSGWALFDDEGSLIEFGQFTLLELEVLDALFTNDLRAAIVEDYRNHGFTQQKKWSRNETSKVIGGIETLGRMHKVPVYLQPNTVKTIGYKWAGLQAQPANHAISHQYDAVAHGVYWLQQNGIRKIGKAMG